MFLLDTNVVSELRKVRAGKADPQVAAWVQTTSGSGLFLSVIVVQELEIGVLQLGRKDPAHRGRSFAYGWTITSFRPSPTASCPSMHRSRGAARASTFRIPGLTGTG